MKLLLEVIISMLIHPLAVILTWIHLAGRTDLSGGQKFLWGVICIIWGIGPILYILLGHGALW